MTGTTVNLSDAWIKSYAARVGCSETAVRDSIKLFQKDVDSYTTVAKKNGYMIICNEEGFPRIDSYLPKKVTDSVSTVSPEEQAKNKAIADEAARKQREAVRAVHNALREKLGMPLLK